MIHNAKEMERLGFQLPLLIGGATTSKAHTAIKIAPCYHAPIVHVGDASLVTEVCNNLLNIDKSEDFIDALKNDQKLRRERFLNDQATIELLPIEEARKLKPKTDWANLKSRYLNTPMPFTKHPSTSPPSLTTLIGLPSSGLGN